MQNLNENYLTSLTISIEEDVKNYKNAIKEEVEKLLKTFKEEYEKTKKDVELNNAIFRMICNLKWFINELDENKEYSLKDISEWITETYLEIKNIY